MKILLGLTALVGTLVVPSTVPGSSEALPAVLHCQVPCGIYGDAMRIDMLMEDCATIEKGMLQLQAMDEQEAPSKNQMVRWVMTKDEHCQSIQTTIASYWLAQRIKSPKEGDTGARAKYLEQLELMHSMTVSAMKCKQTTDPTHVANLRAAATRFSSTYFNAEDLKHIHEHHGGGHK